MRISSVSFCGKPDNYAIIDNYVSRSAQPELEDLRWLKEQGVTDIFNFRTMYKPEINFDEEKEVKALGMKYHSIPSKTSAPSKENIFKFIKEIEEIKQRGGKPHLHCFAGADRTGMYAFIYKTLNNIGNIAGNKEEWLRFGHHKNRYPNLMDWTENFVKKLAHK